jgi:hypothetical protein
MKKINERTLTKQFIQTSLISELHREKKENRLLKEQGFSIGGLGFHGSRAGTGFSSQPKITIQSWGDFDEDNSQFEEVSFSGENSYNEDESMEGSVDESFESLGDEGYFDMGMGGNFKPGDHFDTSNMFYNDIGEDDYFANGEEGASEKPPKLDKKGNISPKELHKHFDLDGDGDVDMGEYTAHIDFHSRHPELLDKWRQLKNKNSKSCPDHDAYCMVGDALLNDYDDILESLENVMSGCGANCHTSSAKALADVVRMLQEIGVI